jgi:hypothetical protein
VRVDEAEWWKGGFFYRINRKCGKVAGGKVGELFLDRIAGFAEFTGGGFLGRVLRGVDGTGVVEGGLFYRINRMAGLTGFF